MEADGSGRSAPVASHIPAIATPPRRLVLEAPFRFLDLPTEIRLKIFRELLPTGKAFEIGPRTLKPYWARSTVDSEPSSCVKFRLEGLYPSVSRTACVIFSVCRQFRVEAGDIIYGENTFRFVISRAARDESYAENPFTYVPDIVLRRMRKCEIRIEETLDHPKAFQRVRRWLERAVQRMGREYEIRTLKVELAKGVFAPRLPVQYSLQGRKVLQFHEEGGVGRRNGFQFVLEPLALLRGLGFVRVMGHVDEGLRRTMGEVMRKERGWEGLKMKKYTRIEAFRRKPAAGRKSWQAITTKKFFQPLYDWGVVGDDEDVMSSD